MGEMSVIWVENRFDVGNYWLNEGNVGEIWVNYGRTWWNMG